MPFIALGVAAVVIGFGMHVFFKGQGGEHEFRPAYATALARLGAYAAIFLVAVVGIYFVATRAGLPEGGRVARTRRRAPARRLHLRQVGR